MTVTGSAPETDSLEIAQVVQTIKTIDLAEDDTEDVDFVASEEELEEAQDSEADTSDEEEENQSEKIALEEELVEEDFCVEIVNGKVKKLKFSENQMEQDSQEEVDSQEEEEDGGITLKSLEADLPDEEESADPDFDPCAETMSDVEVDAEEMSQDEMETENVEGVHKKTGEIHKCIKINADQMKVMTGGDKEETEEMKE
ncbi:unnamed protein product [Oikopleura dioica]|uniref:Uncharacterized protein n=1 Tax=Oikopleura dioica TaxID=34765 RepID=E4WQ96_OIKDI|nr:unnamed protein product [Oikopleura dioica]